MSFAGLYRVRRLHLPHPACLLPIQEPVAGPEDTRLWSLQRRPVNPRNSGLPAIVLSPRPLLIWIVRVDSDIGVAGTMGATFSWYSGYQGDYG